jgi:exodeoxyribonuclease VII small subunit
MNTNKKKTTKIISELESDNTPPATVTFENALEELGTIVHSLEQDDLTLNDALSYFERGISLMKMCDTHLNHARGKITELLKGEDGAFAEKILGMSLESFLNEDAGHD